MPPLRLLTPSHWPTWLGLGLLRMLAPLPLPLLHALGGRLGRVMGLLPIRQVHVARTNIELCFPELSAVQRKQLLKQHFVNIGITMFETALAWWASDARIQRLTDVEGIEHHLNPQTIKQLQKFVSFLKSNPKIMENFQD